ncbi:probable BOI-related E3 ubiquitin-protein ligase 2 [Sesamum indicum]|uniref:Probable BOI-related E3 ubiquitin-protein ligase 2 n=1 Tax=Sesamum indicum TaxID=4182 RepID=A0A6I9TSA6_SESIN|nr:probable BOI-related E3 ubiquitin-protein ligase 2 [Sesamum indicum]
MAIQAQIYSGFGFGCPQDLLMMENARGFSNQFFIQKPQQEHQPQPQPQPLIMHKSPILLPTDDDHHHQSMLLSHSIENQRMEIDLFINSQNERLRLALQEQRKQQIALFMKKYESKIQFLIKQKEEEIARAAKKSMELQDFLKRMEAENQTWQRVARENEAMVASLNSTIERLREAVGNAAEDAESCCVEEEKKTQTWVENASKMVCRCCNSRNSCVIMLPCRHLCSCRDCEALLDSCPVCTTVKKASIEALF